VTHGGRVRRRLARSLRVRLGLLMLALAVFPAVFAELLAADQPIVAYGPSGWTVLPAIVGPAAAAEGAPSRVAERYQDDLTLWPLVRAGPGTVCAEGPNRPPSWRHPLGTDSRGRDVTARLIYGARSALGVAALVLCLSLLLGGLLGAAAGYFGGFWDELLGRPVELIQAFPAVVVVAVARAIEPEATLWSLALALAAARWAEVARLVRAEVMRVCAEDFVVAARALGCSRRRLLGRHILPHAAGPVAVSLVFGVAAVVGLETAVSFVGLGSDGSWGVLIADGIAQQAPPAALLAALVAVAATVGAAALLADAMAEALDARLATTGRRFDASRGIVASLLGRG